MVHKSILFEQAHYGSFIGFNPIAWQMNKKHAIDAVISAAKQPIETMFDREGVSQCSMSERSEQKTIEEIMAKYREIYEQ